MLGVTVSVIVIKETANEHVSNWECLPRWSCLNLWT